MRARLPALLALGLALPPAAAMPPGDGPGDAPPSEGGGSLAERVTPEQREAIDRGLRWLASRQDPSGSFPTTVPGDGPGNKKSADYQTAVTALSTLAFLGAGHGLRHGPYRKVVYRGVDWLLRAQEGSGVPGYVSFTNDGQSRMHGHGFATLALAEAYGTAASRDSPESEGRGEEDQNLRSLSRRLREGIEKAVRCIESSQSATGGWGYTPSAGGTTDHEGSVTVCQVQALLAAGNRGFRVSLERVQAARGYMKRSQTRLGGFRYRLSEEEDFQNPSSYSWALAAAGVTSLLGLAEYDRKEAIDRGLRYMEAKERGGPRYGSTHYFFYGSFYAVQAFHWAGGERWERFWNPMRLRLLNEQAEDGSWEGKDTALGLGDVYPTALCLLMLEVPVGYLSVFAR